MNKILLFTGDISPLADSGRPSGIASKRPVTGPLELDSNGFVGDQQADRRVHGGPEKAVHLYPAGHYAKLARRFPDAASLLVPGSIGENISAAELDEAQVRIGDIWQLGSARLQLCQPRNPCWKIDARFASDGMAEFIANERLTGWYFRVLQAGIVGPDDVLALSVSANDAMTLDEALRLWQMHRPPLGELERLAAQPGISPQWLEKIEKRLVWLRSNA